MIPTEQPRIAKEQHNTQGWPSDQVFAECPVCEIGVFAKLADVLEGGIPVHDRCAEKFWKLRKVSQ